MHTPSKHWRRSAEAERIIEAPPTWTATTTAGAKVRLCAHHLVADEGLRDVMPAEVEGPCSLCSTISPSRHAVERWQLRVGGHNATEAGAQMLAFAAGAVTVDKAPKWMLGTIPHDCEVLLNERWEGVGLLARRGNGGRVVIITTITATEG